MQNNKIKNNNNNNNKCLFEELFELLEIKL